MRLLHPDAAGLKVFISYLRSDTGFADQLVAALTAYGMTPSIDRSAIHGAGFNAGLDYPHVSAISSRAKA